MYRRALCLLALAGCSFDPAGVPGAGDDLADGGAIEGGCACALGCEADGRTCLAFEPSNLDDLSPLDRAGAPPSLGPGTWTLDTTGLVLRDPGNAPVDAQITLIDK